MPDMNIQEYLYRAFGNGSESEFDAIAAAIDGGHKLSRVLTGVFQSDAGNGKPLDVKVNTGHADGLRTRFAVENNPNQALIDINVRSARMLIGNPDTGVSADGTGIDFYQPSTATGQPLRVYKVGSTTNTVFYIQPSGSVVLQCTDTASTCFTLRNSSGSGTVLRISQLGALQMDSGAHAGATNTGAALSYGTGAPNNANGSNGDIYLRSDGGAGTTIYHKRSGSWVGIV